MVLRSAIPIPAVITDKDLPESDGLPVENLAQMPQAQMLTSAIRPVLERLHPDGLYLIGSDSGIYWERTDPPLDGCKAPDWFYVPGVSQTRPEDGDYRRSYVMWNERQPPYLVVEFVSGNGATERDRTAGTGKFWVYENGIRAECYAIFDPLDEDRRLEMYERVRGSYRLMKPNQHGHYELPELGVALGTLEGDYANHHLHWLRFFDLAGQPLPNDVEQVALLRERANTEARLAAAERQRAEKEKQRAEQEKQRAEQEKQRADQSTNEMIELKAKLKAKGIDPAAL